MLNLNITHTLDTANQGSPKGKQQQPLHGKTNKNKNDLFFISIGIIIAFSQTVKHLSIQLNV
jgi:hypothetical protein